MKLEDDLIVLRPFAPDDVPALTAALRDDPEVDRWTRIPSSLATPLRSSK